MSSPLNKFHILIADADQQLAGVMKSMLKNMGFPNVETTRSGEDVLEHVKHTPVDFLLTEWNLQHLNGINLIQRIRRDPGSRTPALPIILLTGRAEESDVSTARDAGINEFVLKPFSVKTIYSRLKRVIEKPRPFIITQSFVGPNRRYASTNPNMPNRRTLHIQPQTPPTEITGNLIGTLPKIWTPDFTLKRKLGTGQSLDRIVTPDMLASAQGSIDAIMSESLQWIKANLAEIKALHHAMQQGQSLSSLGEQIGQVALQIHARGGMFGYGRAAEVAYMLYLFCHNQQPPGNKNHDIIIEKHIEVLEIILGNDPLVISGKLGEQIVMELHNLTIKLKRE